MENKKETLTAAEEQKRQQQFIEKARIYVEKNQKNWDVRYMHVRLPSGAR